MKLYIVFALVVTFAITIEGLFDYVPRTSCSYNNQCWTRKCVKKGNPFCGFGSKQYLLIDLESTYRLNLFYLYSDVLGRIFGGRRRSERRCDWKECAECTTDWHCK